MPKFLIRARHLVIPLYSIYCSRVMWEIFSPLEHRSPNLSSFDVVGLMGSCLSLLPHVRDSGFQNPGHFCLQWQIWQIGWIQNMEYGYRKIPKISPGVYIFQRPFLKGLFLEGLIFGGGLSTEGNLRFKIDWASLIVGRKFTFFALFFFVFEGNFPGTSLGRLIFGGAI